MASGPCLRRCRVVRRYMPMRIQHHRPYVKPYASIHVSMSFEPLRKGNTVNTGVPCPKVPIHRKLGFNGATDCSFREPYMDNGMRTIQQASGGGTSWGPKPVKKRAAPASHARLTARVL